jgi:hypothetical protein
MPEGSIGFEELAGQRAALLPDRETLFVDINVAPIVGINVATAINAATIDSVTSAAAWQDLIAIIG